MTMLSRYMKEQHHQHTHPSRERRTVWKKVISTLNCCGGSQPRADENVDQYQPKPRRSPQHITVHETGNGGRKLPPLPKKIVQLSERGKVKPTSGDAKPKRQRQLKKNLNHPKKVSVVSKRRGAIIHPINESLKKPPLDVCRKFQTRKLLKQSHCLDLMNVSTIINYAKSISILTLRSLSPDGKESIKDALKLQKGVIKNLVKLPRGMIPHLQNKVDLCNIAKDAPTKAHLSTRKPVRDLLPVKCGRPLPCRPTSIAAPKGKCVPPQGPHPIHAWMEDVDVARANREIKVSRKEVDIAKCATKPPRVTARQANHVHRPLPIPRCNVKMEKSHRMRNVENGGRQVAMRSAAVQVDLQASREVKCKGVLKNEDGSCKPAIKPNYNKEEAGRVVIKSRQTLVEKKPPSGRVTPAQKLSILRNLFPECELISQRDLQQVVDPITNKPVTLGSGSFGVVSLMQTIKTGKLCAVKKFQDSLDKASILAEAKMEVSMLSKLRGLSCVPELYGIVPAEGTTWVPSVVKEFIGDAKSYKSSTLEAALRKDVLSVPSLYHVALNLVKALMDVHSRRILHCDLKFDNVMLMPGFRDQRNQEIKIIDFGRAKNMDRKPRYEHYAPEIQRLVLMRCTQIAPEVVAGREPYSEYSDIYSLGVMFIGMAGNRRLKFLKNIGKSCINETFDQRPTLRELNDKLTSYISKKNF